MLEPPPAQSPLEVFAGIDGPIKLLIYLETGDADGPATSLAGLGLGAGRGRVSPAAAVAAAAVAASLRPGAGIDTSVTRSHRSPSGMFASSPVVRLA